MNKLAGLVPMNNRVLVQRAISATTSSKGIIVSTGDKKQRTFVAKVIAVGAQAFKETRDGKTLIWHEVPVGTEVLLSEYSGTRI